jgi:hypothetical protein
MNRIYQLTDEAVVLHASLKSKTLTPAERKQRATDLEETLALRDFLQAETDKAEFTRLRPWTDSELNCPPESELMRGPVGAGGGLSRRARR